MWASANSLPLQNIIVGQCVYVKLQCDLNLKKVQLVKYIQNFFFLFSERRLHELHTSLRGSHPELLDKSVASCLQFTRELCLSPNTAR